MKTIKTSYKEIINEEKQGKELYFDSIPTYEERKILKKNGYKYHTQKKCWYISENKLKNPPSQNALGVKVGDIFYMSWGFEQTNLDFFQVVELKGKTQVIIKEVVLNKVEEDGYEHGMARDVIFDPKIAVPIQNSVFVKDNEKGMIKKVYGTKENPYLNMTSYANAHLYKGQKLYESWYY